MKQQQPVFVQEENKTICKLYTENGTEIIGIATCHPADEDMKNNHTGCEIAFRRATINVYRYYKNDLKIRLGALKQLYYSMNRSKKFNEKSYENIMLQRQIHLLESDLATIKDLITTEKQNLHDYITAKENFYTVIRANREKKNKKANIE